MYSKRNADRVRCYSDEEEEGYYQEHDYSCRKNRGRHLADLQDRVHSAQRGGYNYMDDTADVLKYLTKKVGEQEHFIKVYMKEKDAEIEQLRKENKELVERLEKVEKLELKERLTTLEEGRAALERRLNSCSAAQITNARTLEEQNKTMAKHRDAIKSLRKKIGDVDDAHFKSSVTLEQKYNHTSDSRGEVRKEWVLDLYDECTDNMNKLSRRVKADMQQLLKNVKKSLANVDSAPCSSCDRPYTQPCSAEPAYVSKPLTVRLGGRPNTASPSVVVRPGETVTLRGDNGQVYKGREQDQQILCVSPRLSRFRRSGGDYYHATHLTLSP
mmetsp:Transcript_34689/g.68204  ORF Transcript_34689/g.68204 Transcript_34689/m.68204 type:complete len:328 (+) Transcript_34689:29-1012(+)|eukprot:CAMPEP_0175138138 /NCGR_PEP_ID=MMETSP0087-20121206/10184_1 /TAXON_ID=136419 /ORGANISM="Unknown Unknown, Strain D1" /LENGTH=327 /DNA_ID=CAMNT_0016421011 /DNA_START=27 /DNA_END=1010 /DNA_ORIENTATION=-